MRALALQGTELANAPIDTLRIRLLKLAAVVTRSTRRIRLYFASNWPSAAIFAQAMRALDGTQQIHPVPGPRVDSNQARNPSRGGGHHTPTTAIPALQSINASGPPLKGFAASENTAPGPYSSTR